MHFIHFSAAFAMFAVMHYSAIFAMLSSLATLVTAWYPVWGVEAGML